MSDYIKNKGIRCKIPKKIAEELDNKYGYIFDEQIIKDWNLPEKFKIEGSCEDYYLQYETYYKYGAYGDYGRVRMLNDEEIKEYLPQFQEVFPDLTKEDLRYVDYCYYNGCDCPDYWNVGDYDYD